MTGGSAEPRALAVDASAEPLLAAWRADAAATEGGFDRFEPALASTWAAADEDASPADATPGTRAVAIGRQALCGLFASARRGLADELPAHALAAAVELGQLGADRARAWIAWMSEDHRRRAMNALAGGAPASLDQPRRPSMFWSWLSGGSDLDPATAPLEQALAEARARGWPLGRAEQLLDLLGRADDALGAVIAEEVWSALADHRRAEGGPVRRVQSHCGPGRLFRWSAGVDELVALAPIALRPRLVADALAMARRAHDDDLEARALAALARALPHEGVCRRDLADAALGAARASVDRERALTLADLLDLVAPPELPTVLADACAALEHAEHDDGVTARLRLLRATSDPSLPEEVRSAVAGHHRRLLDELRAALADPTPWLNVGDDLAALPADVRDQLPALEPRRDRTRAEPPDPRPFATRWRAALHEPAWRGRADALATIAAAADDLAPIPGAIEAVARAILLARGALP